ncbi:VOC family protein [Streptomyces sp. SID4919]|uniref:VOC family protein n=1 Tax=Streptomyces TaxID=1883 RepID=UPI000823D37E|nr:MULTISPECIES: glyoxalase [unclassified Streptomyces]MYY07865.1 VOC family protein [Streptomyces sp. SID4919]SCK06476.1 Glyoxalase-like domain-containing protein [Streptomyces sp. AmelKG-E11A]
MRIGSLLIGSENVEQMKSWYRSAFSVTENDGGAFPLGDVQLFIEEHSEVSGPNEDAARVIVNLDVDDCRALETHLLTLDVTWVRKVEQMPFGLIGTLADPDGNYVQIIQWGAEPGTHPG